MADAQDRRCSFFHHRKGDCGGYWAQCSQPARFWLCLNHVENRSGGAIYLPSGATVVDADLSPTKAPDHVAETARGQTPVAPEPPRPVVRLIHHAHVPRPSLKGRRVGKGEMVRGLVRDGVTEERRAEFPFKGNWDCTLSGLCQRIEAACIEADAVARQWEAEGFEVERRLGESTFTVENSANG